MLRSCIVLPNGTRISSGAGTENALKHIKITQRVNSGKELTLGSVCANMLEAKLITPGGELNIAAGTELTLLRIDDAGVETQIGLFTMEKPSRPSGNTYQITAYDRVSRLDKDLSDWLAELTQWPYSLLDFAGMVCEACGLQLTTTEIPNGAFPVQQFAATGVTGRMLMQWVGQACGRFCRANAKGELELAWYSEKPIAITPGGQYRYFLNGLSYEDYSVASIDKVQISLTEADVGTVYGTGGNTYRITGNYLLATDSAEDLQAVARTIYEILQGVSYTPCKVSVPATLETSAGDILHITDRNGKSFPFYVMTKVQAGQRDTLECVGSARRDSTSAVNYARFAGVGGKVLELQAGMDGLRIENRHMHGEMEVLKPAVESAQNTANNNSGQIQNLRDSISATNEYVSSLAVNQNGITAAVEHINRQVQEGSTGLTTLSKRVDAAITQEDVEILIRQAKEQGAGKVVTATGYTFDETGFTIEKSGKEMKTQITEDGMTVYKNTEAVLTADNTGVDAVNLHASTYLIVGGKSRFENYGNRTGCFWIG